MTVPVSRIKKFLLPLMAGEPGGPQVPTPMLPDALWAQGMSAQRAYQVLSLLPQMLPTTSVPALFNGRGI